MVYSSSGCVIIHGGGLVDPSKEVIMRLADKVSQTYQPVKIGQYSFESLYTPKFLVNYSKILKEVTEGKRGTYFGTCRDIDLSQEDKLQKTIDCLVKNRIGTLIVAGGDGSSRQVAEIAEAFEKSGINIIFAVPLTIDGINGGRSIGMDQAVRESIRQIENIVSTSLMTRDNEKFGVVAVELQGRNRDDIIANVLRYFWRQGKVADCNLEDMLLRVVPANYQTDKEKLIDEINSSSQRTLILVSEGSQIKISELKDQVNRKVRSLAVGHPSQSNGLTTEEDMQSYEEWLNDAAILIKETPKKTFCIVNDGCG